MSLAQAGQYSENVVMPAGQTSGYSTWLSKDINIPAPDGAIPRYLITYQTTVYNMETQQLETKTITAPTFGMVRLWTSSMGYPSHFITLSRKDRNTLNVYDIVETFNTDENFPSITFKVTVSYIYPPNA